MRGVVELGVTEQVILLSTTDLLPVYYNRQFKSCCFIVICFLKVLEDPSLIHHIKTSFLEIPYAVAAKNSSARSDKELVCATFNRETLDTKPIPVIGDITSPTRNSNDQPVADSIMVEGLQGGASQVQSRQFMYDDFSTSVHHSLNSSDCISQTIVDPVKVVPILKNGKLIDQNLLDVQDCNHTKLTPLDLQSDDFHYQSVLSCLLKTTNALILGPNVQNCHQESSFVSWKKAGLVLTHKLKSETQQKVLKKILLEVPRMHVDGLPDSPEYNSNKVVVGTPEADENGASHVLSERKQKEKLNKRFMILKSIVPSISKVVKN